jgi:hypothetical protein
MKVGWIEQPLICQMYDMVVPMVLGDTCPANKEDMLTGTEICWQEDLVHKNHSVDETNARVK